MSWPPTGIKEAWLRSTRTVPQQAVEDFETALVYAKQDDDEYRVRLAESLLAAGRPNEARSRLLSLLEDHPTDAMVNLELARIAAGKGELQDAIRYYRGAIDGIWSPGKIARGRTPEYAI